MFVGAMHGMGHEPNNGVGRWCLVLVLVLVLCAGGAGARFGF